MKKKMCDQYEINPGYNWVCRESCRRNMGICNNKCEIIPSKRKRIAKLTKTVRGMAWWEDGKLCTYKGIGKGRSVMFNEWKGYVPCRITPRVS